MTQLEKFLAVVAQDETLQQQLNQAPSKEAAIELAVELGQKSGYSFTSQEVEAKFAEEMDDDELDAVAGGVVQFGSGGFPGGGFGAPGGQPGGFPGGGFGAPGGFPGAPGGQPGGFGSAPSPNLGSVPVTGPDHQPR